VISNITLYKLQQVEYYDSVQFPKDGQDGQKMAKTDRRQLVNTNAHIMCWAVRTLPLIYMQNQLNFFQQC